jgi:hypothetical protein
VTSISKSDFFILWRAACVHQGTDPNVYTQTFGSDNLYAIQAKRFKAVLTGTEF